jgi:hypothetical protein
MTVKNELVEMYEEAGVAYILSYCSGVYWRYRTKP